MKILIVGGGGREHALGWRLAQDEGVSGIISAPGNPGLADLGPVFDIRDSDVPALTELARQEKPDLVVVGPEAPLAEGLTDALVAEGVPVFGPTREAAQLESSKSFAKEVCEAAAAPTAGYQSFSEVEPALAHLERVEPPFVVKADGLAAGKGVIIAERLEDARRAVTSMFEGVYGEAGASVVIEDFMEGEETSIFAFIDGETVVPLAGARDHKRAYDHDRGPNTGGMGAVSPNPRLSRWAIEETVDVILQPVAREMVRRGTPYRGVIYAGVILDAMGPRLLEFNVRFGDPEAQVILPRIQGNLARHLKAAAEGRLHEAEALSLSERVATCVVMASRGYPDAYTRGTEIRGVDDAAGLEDVIVFHAGTRRENGRLLSNGGRVLGITGLGDSTEASVDKAYEAVAKIDWPEGFCRSDIGRRKGTDIS